MTAAFKEGLPQAEALFETLWDTPMSDRGRLTVRVFEVKLSGLDHGRTVIRSISQVPTLGTILTLHEAGSSHWVGRGMERGYSGASTFTVLIVPDTVHSLNRDIRTFRYVRLTHHVEGQILRDRSRQQPPTAFLAPSVNRRGRRAMITGFENAEGILLLRQGCYSVQAHPVHYFLMPGTKLIPNYHVCGEVLNPIALLVDTLIFANTGQLPDGVAVFSMEKANPNHKPEER